MKSRKIIFLAAILILPLVPAKVNGDRVDDFINNKQIVASLNDFGFDIFRKMCDKQKGKNVLISPYSASTILCMVSNGTIGKTREQLLKKLNLTEFSQEEINKAASDTLSTLVQNGNGRNINISNSIWIPDFIQIKTDFLYNCKKSYLAEAQPLRNKFPNATEDINKWIKKKTNGNINDIDKKQDFFNSLYIVNVLNFKASWKNKFKKNQTIEKDFHLADGRTQKVNMMKQTGARYSYYENESLQAVALEYKNDVADMYIFLPNKDIKLYDFIKILDFKILNEITKEFKVRKGTVEFPKFSFETESLILNPVLKEMGVKRLFSKNVDLSNIRTNKLFVTQIVQKNAIKIDEDGTVASSATEMKIAAFYEAKDEPFNFIADRPFLYFIRDTKTGVVLFVGAVESVN